MNVFHPKLISVILKQKFGVQRLRRQPEMDMVMLDEEQDAEYSRDGEMGALAVVYDFVIHSVVQISPSRGHALDIASGSGQLLAKLAAAMPELQFTGTDLSDHMLELGRKNARFYGARNIDFIRQDMYELAQLAPRQFDLITWSLALHHCHRSNDVLKVLEGAHALLKPGGTFFVFDIIRPKTGEIAVTFADIYNQGQGSWYYQDSLDSYKAAYTFEELGVILSKSSFGSMKHIQPRVANFFQMAYLSATPRQRVRAKSYLHSLKQKMAYFLMRLGFAGRIV